MQVLDGGHLTSPEDLDRENRGVYRVGNCLLCSVHISDNDKNRKASKYP